MRSHPLNRIGLCILTLLLALGLVAPGVTADCAGNTLANGGFEGSFSDRADGQILVADGWGYFFQNGPFAEDGLNVRPTFGQERNGTRVREGAASQAFGMAYSTHNAGVYQQVQVPSGSDVSLSAWGLAWSSTGDNSSVSEGGKYYMSIGIDPTGGTNWASPSVVWTGESTTLDQWVNLTLSAKDSNTSVTVFLRGRAEWKIKQNYSYWDDVCVTYAAPPPPPTNIPAPTALPTETTPPTATPEPSATPAPEPTATPAPGSIAVTVFEDLDGNGIKASGESAISGAAVELRAADGTTVASFDSNGTITTQDLAAGIYTVSLSAPTGYILVTPNQTTISLLAGEDANVSIAVKAAPTAIPTSVPNTIAPTTDASTAPTPTPAPGQENATSTRGDGWAGILVAAIAVIVLVAYRILRNTLK